MIFRFRTKTCHEVSDSPLCGEPIGPRAFSDESLVESEGVEVFEQSLRPAEALPGFRPSGIMHDHRLDQSPQSLFFRSEIPDGREFGDCAVEDGIEGVLLKIKADWPVLHDELERAGRKI